MCLVSNMEGCGAVPKYECPAYVAAPCWTRSRPTCRRWQYVAVLEAGRGCFRLRHKAERMISETLRVGRRP